MALYPPLTKRQLDRINTHLFIIQAARTFVVDVELSTVTSDEEVDDLSLHIATLRGAIAALDMEVFGTWKLIQSLREENFPVTPSRAEKSKATIDSILEQL